MTTTTRSPSAAVRSYTESVRAHLSDLPPEVIDELAGGLEVDLEDALADRNRTADTPLEAFGSPVAYAAELRDAAGLPPAPSATAGSQPAGSHPANSPGIAQQRASFLAGIRSTATALADGFRQLLGSLRTSRFVARVSPLVGDLCPVWWVARGWFLGALIASWLGGSPGTSLIPWRPGDLTVMLVTIVISVQWGRGRWKPWRWITGVIVVASVIALVAAPTVINGTTWANAWGMRTAHEPVETVPRDGLFVDGTQVSNLFVYDGEGQPVPNAQIFDARGVPVTLSVEGSEASGTWGDNPMVGGQGDDGNVLQPSVSVEGTAAWNVFPLPTFRFDVLKESPDGELVPTTGALPLPTAWPFPNVPRFESR
ncbi:MAG: hypothetical protein LBH13_05660 [Cellulomonadaceae bacterium]|nr:hypothetical protein [Cellulomonadaceae bacterium]